MSTIDLNYTDDYEAQLFIKGSASRTVEIAVFEDGYRTAFEVSANELIGITDEIRDALGVEAAPVVNNTVIDAASAAHEAATEEGLKPVEPLYGVSSPYSETQPTEVRMNAATVANALTLGLGVRFRYVKGENSDPVKRELSEVTDLITTRDGEHVVIGYDSDRDDFRSYRLDRIRGYVRVRD